MSSLSSFDDCMHGFGIEFIVGVDEAGRGPLAGPVVAGAVMLRPRLHQDGIDDSKRLTEAQRERAFAWILRSAIYVGIGVVWPNEIDEINIRQASLVSMAEAVHSVDVRPDLILVDGRDAPKVDFPCLPLVHGDGRSESIAAASIVAKVVRDHLMNHYDQVYPGYGFARHKGYATREHLEALAKYGPCPIHRRSFRGVMP